MDRRALLALTLLPSPGCLFPTIGDSCEVETSEIAAITTAAEDRSALTVQILLRQGSSGPNLELCADDVMTVDGEEPDSQGGGGLSTLSYVRTWDSPADAPESIEIVLERGLAATQVQWSVTRATAFELLAPLQDQEVSRGAEFVVQWDPVGSASAEIGLHIVAPVAQGLPCVRTSPGSGHQYDAANGEQVPDIGRRLIPAGALALDDPSTGQALSEHCPAGLTLTRIATGEYPDELDGSGSNTATLSRQASFWLSP